SMGLKDGRHRVERKTTEPGPDERGGFGSGEGFAGRIAPCGERGARAGKREDRQLLEESLHSADDAVPRLLFVLYVSQRSGAAGRAFHDAGGSAGAGRRGKACGMQGSAV